MRLLILFSKDLLSDLFRITLAFCFDDEGILCRSHRCRRRRRLRGDKKIFLDTDFK